MTKRAAIQLRWNARDWILLRPLGTTEDRQVCHRRINIEEATGTSYTGRNNLCFPFYTDCIIIVRCKIKNMRNYKSKRFGKHEIKKGKFKGAFHIATKDYKEFLGEISYLKDYLNRRILPAEPEEVLMTSILINLVNALDNEMVLIIKKQYKNKPSKNGDKLVERINEGFVSFKEKFTWMSKHKLIDNVQYHIMDDVRVLRNKHTHYRFSLRRPKFKYLNYPLMTKKSLRNIFIDCNFLLEHLRKISGKRAKWQIIPPGYAEELSWGNLNNIYIESKKKREK